MTYSETAAPDPTIEGHESSNVGTPPTPLPPELPPVDPFPLDALPEAFRGWALDVADRMQCPPDFVAVPMLVGASMLAARAVAIRPQAATDWTVHANLWALIVGRPGAMKSPALAQALRPLHAMEAKAAGEYNLAAADRVAAQLEAKLRATAVAKQAQKKLSDDPNADVKHMLGPVQQVDEVPRARYVVNDTTYEALGKILCENPSGILVERDELRGFLLYLAREENAQARGFFLTAWSGGPYTFDRIGRGTVTIPDARLSLIGAIQPGPLSELIHASRKGGSDDGMLERFLVAWPDDPGEWREVDRLPDGPARRQAEGAFARLDELSKGIGTFELSVGQDASSDGAARGIPYLRLEENARILFSEWHAQLERRIRSPDAEGYEGALSKFRHHVPALGLTLHLADGGCGPVSRASMAKAIQLGDYFESQARRCYSSGQRAAIRAARAILNKLRSGQIAPTFTAREVYRAAWSGLSEKQVVYDALSLLEAHSWLSSQEIGTGGRPTVYYTARIDLP